MTEDAKGKGKDADADAEHARRIDELRQLCRDFFFDLRRMAPKDTSHEVQQNAYTIITGTANALCLMADADHHKKLANAAEIMLAPLHDAALESRYVVYVEILRALAQMFTPKKHQTRRAFRVPFGDNKFLVAFEKSTVIDYDALKRAIEQLREKCDPRFEFLDYWGDPRVNHAIESLSIQTRGGPGKPGFYRAAAEIALTVGAFNTFDIDLDTPKKRRDEIRNLQGRIKKACSKHIKASEKVETPQAPAVTPPATGKKKKVAI